MTIHNVRAISAECALSDSRWGVYHRFMTRTGDDPQLTYHGRLATPIIYDVIGVTRFFENRFPPQFLLQPLFLLGHVSAKHNAHVRETRVYLNTSACKMVGRLVVLRGGDRGHQDSEFGTSNFFPLALSCSLKSVGPPTVGPVGPLTTFLAMPVCVRVIEVGWVCPPG